MQATLNFRHYFVLEARRSKKFKELDDKVRVMSIELGKGTGDRTEYDKLLKQRDKMLDEFIAEQTLPPQKTEFGAKTEAGIAKALENYCDKFPKTKLINIVLTGAAGTGKTYCAKIAAQKLRHRGFGIHFTSTYNLIKRIRDYSFGADPGAYGDLIESDLLIIDDLGTEPELQNNDDFLYTVINERYTAERAFIITTNLDNEQIFNRYNQRITGRIFDKNKTAVIRFTGKDLRIE
jgi:DNA replication protein DnaC